VEAEDLIEQAMSAARMANLPYGMRHAFLEARVVA
jgi:hypothetical protein